MHYIIDQHLHQNLNQIHQIVHQIVLHQPMLHLHLYHIQIHPNIEHKTVHQHKIDHPKELDHRNEIILNRHHNDNYQQNDELTMEMINHHQRRNRKPSHYQPISL